MCCGCSALNSVNASLVKDAATPGAPCFVPTLVMILWTPGSVHLSFTSATCRPQGEAQFRVPLGAWLYVRVVVLWGVRPLRWASSRPGNPATCLKGFAFSKVNSK